MSVISPALLNPLGIVSAIVSTLEAGLYSHVESGGQNEGKIARWIKNTSISRFPVIQRVMSAANSILFLIPTYILTENVLTKYHLAPIYPKLDNFGLILGCSTVALVGTLALGTFILYYLSRGAKRKVGEVEIAAPNTKTQAATKVILMAKIAGSIAASFFANPVWFALTAVSTGYSLWKNYRIKWLNVTRDPHPIDIDIRQNSESNAPRLDTMDIRKVVTTYRMLQIPAAVQSSLKDNCGICHKQFPNIAFCAKHLVHQKCLERQVGDATRSMLEEGRFTKFRVTHTRNGVPTGTSYRYSIELKKSKMPSCITCGDVPLQNKCSVTFHDRQHGVLEAKVTVKN